MHTPVGINVPSSAFVTGVRFMQMIPSVTSAPSTSANTRIEGLQISSNRSRDGYFRTFSESSSNLSWVRREDDRVDLFHRVLLRMNNRKIQNRRFKFLNETLDSWRAGMPGEARFAGMAVICLSCGRKKARGKSVASLTTLNSTTPCD